MASVPNLANVVESLQIISRHFSSLCDELGRLDNLPSVDILTQLRNLNDSIAVKAEMKKVSEQLNGIKQRLATLEQATIDRFAAIEHNAYARHCNGKTASNWNQQYFTLRSISTQPIPNFPRTGYDLDRLDGATINGILTALNLPTTGDVQERRHRLKRWIGLAEKCREGTEE
ncbi:hypothetical protein BDD12DRAFT_807836 [Trichophaea hybrida]|nr:hypothetical protein BDD12DRAFT_807836 [Trichophaea hybrida]